MKLLTGKLSGYEIIYIYRLILHEIAGSEGQKKVVTCQEMVNL